MKKIDIVNLIRCYSEGDNTGFLRQAEAISQEFYDNGDVELANYIGQLLSSATSFVPQDLGPATYGALERAEVSQSRLLLPEQLKESIVGVANAAKRNIGINTFLFYGQPGTGKTEAASQVARVLRRTLWKVNIAMLIDSHLGETSKNIASLFSSIATAPFRSKMLILFDEIDALALRRNDSRDMREMARATTELFKGLDGLPSDVIVIATTNLQSELDKALLRRFSAQICFDVYSHEDLVEIGASVFKELADLVPDIEPNDRLVIKILDACPNLPSPGELKNIIKSAVGFSSLKNKEDYLAKLFTELFPQADITDLSTLSNKYGFSSREISSITGISKSEVARRIKK